MTVRTLTDQVEADVAVELEYIGRHPEWLGSTVHTSLLELADAAVRLRGIEAALTGTNSYANGPRRVLDDAFRALASEVAERVAIWRVPLWDERGEHHCAEHDSERAFVDGEWRAVCEQVWGLGQAGWLDACRFVPEDVDDGRSFEATVAAEQRELDAFVARVPCSHTVPGTCDYCPAE